MSKRLLAVLLFCAAPAAMAKDVDIQTACTSVNCQDAFDTMAEDLVAGIDYKAVGPAEATGTLGFGVGLVGTYVPVGDEWKTVTGSDFSGFGLVGLQVTKGLPLNLDLGAFYTTAPGSNVDVYGGEIRYAFLPGSTVAPAFAVRASYVTVSGIEDFDLDSKSVDVSLSKGVGPITPFIGAGYVKGAADPDPSTTLKKAEVDGGKYFIGVRLSLGLLEFTPQFSQINGVTTYSARMGFSFSL